MKLLDLALDFHNGASYFHFEFPIICLLSPTLFMAILFKQWPVLSFLDCIPGKFGG